MVFVPDKRFASRVDAFEFLSERYSLLPTERPWVQAESGLFLPRDMPRYLFRGECGEFDTTKAAMSRPHTYKLKNSTPLSTADLDTLQQLIPELARRFILDDYSLDGHSAIGLLQHYGLP